MGCDVHMFIEEDAGYAHEEAPRWILRAAPFVWRDYTLFGFLAGVRCKDLDHITPKGLPDSLDPETEAAVRKWAEDGHTHSWLTAKEFTEACQRRIDHREVAVEVGKSIRQVHALQAFVAHLADENPEGARVVFWFDN